MKLVTRIIVAMMIISAAPVFAFDGQEVVQKLRDFVEKVAGDELAAKIFGPKDDIILPEIPKIQKDAKKVVERTDEKASMIPADQAKKLDYGYVMELFEVTRRSKPSQSEISDWMNVLSQGATREGVYRALVLDQTYYGLENFQKPVSDRLAEYASTFMQTYLGQMTELEKLKSANFFTMKRILTEKSLEVIDEFLNKNPEDCYRWFAVLSAELANKFPSSWKNDLRRSNSRFQHFNWAKSVPEQHLKSEVIVKLHTVFNSLQD